MPAFPGKLHPRPPLKSWQQTICKTRRTFAQRLSRIGHWNKGEAHRRTFDTSRGKSGQHRPHRRGCAARRSRRSVADLTEEICFVASLLLSHWCQAFSLSPRPLPPSLSPSLYLSLCVCLSLSLLLSFARGRRGYSLNYASTKTFQVSRRVIPPRLSPRAATKTA